METTAEVLSYLQKQLKAPKAQKNNFGNYNYRSCEDILEAVKPLLPEGYSILMADNINHVGDRFYVEASARLFRGVDDFIEVKSYARESDVKKGMDAAQITGASSSYARKYALSGLLAIDDTKDADTKDNRISDKDRLDPESPHFDAKFASTHTKKRLLSFTDVSGLFAYWQQDTVKKRIGKIYEQSEIAANFLAETFEKQKEALDG